MAITREFPWQYQGICFGKTRDFYLTEYTALLLDTAFLKTALSIYPVPKHIAQDMELCHQPTRQHEKPIGAYEERDHQQPRAVADGICKNYEQPEKAENAARMQRMPLERPTTNTRNHDTTASTAMTGANRSFKRKRISFSSIHFVL